MSSSARILKLDAYLLLDVLRQNIFTVFQKLSAAFVMTVKFGGVLFTYDVRTSLWRITPS